MVATNTFASSDLRNKHGEKEYTTSELRQMAMDYLLEKEATAQQWRIVFFFVFVIVCVFGCAAGVSIACRHSLQSTVCKGLKVSRRVLRSHHRMAGAL